ncbi:MAG: chemotaxis protein CheW [Phaeospirillum sp.]|nr:chemotaxis protein CheW [Phaeospirillum sp.]
MADHSTRQFISFTVGDEEYGVDIMAIREIKGWTPTTPLPETPAHMRGVIDLRGAIVPIIDLRVRFHHGLTEVTPTHVIIVVAIGDVMVGLLADAVVDIVTVAATEIQPMPDSEHGGGANYLSGIVSVEGRMVVLLDLTALLERDRDVLAEVVAVE